MTPHRLRLARVRRIAAPVAFAAAFVAAAYRFGLPLSKAAVLCWVVAGLACFSRTGLRRTFVGIAVDWVPFALILLAYDAARAKADELLPTHVWPQLRADELLFGAVPTTWLQARLWHGAGHVDWYDYAASGVYLTHFFATFAVAAVVWVVAHDRFRRWVTMVSALAVLGVTTYALFPAAPPWLAAQEGALPPTDRIVRHVFENVRVFHLDTMFDRGARYSNDVAAMPSLHAATSLLIVLYLWSLVPRAWRVPLALYPPAMAFALVYTGEHYAIDVLVGWLYAFATFRLVNALADRRASAQLPLEPVENRLEPQHAMEG